MVAEKRIYSTTALQNCYRALRSARWSVRRKDEHMTRCCEVRELYAKCQVNLGCVLDKEKAALRFQENSFFFIDFPCQKSGHKCPECHRG